MTQPSTPRPNFIWDTDPDVRIMQATYCCDSPTIEELVRSYIPEAQLWGDGRLLWTERDEETAASYPDPEWLLARARRDVADALGSSQPGPPYHMPLVEDGDQLYRIILQVPGVSWSEP